MITKPLTKKEIQQYKGIKLIVPYTQIRRKNGNVYVYGLHPKKDIWLIEQCNGIEEALNVSSSLCDYLRWLFANEEAD